MKDPNKRGVCECGNNFYHNEICVLWEEETQCHICPNKLLKTCEGSYIQLECKRCGFKCKAED